jgi:CDP-glycerol glycerophosphotransferase (TagB/SpsB family)
MSDSENNGIYFFLGNITSHILHALPLYKEIGGTFVVTSKKAARELERKYQVPVVYKDDIPHVWRWTGKRPQRVKEYIQIDKRLRRTVNFLNDSAHIVIFYELFEFAEDVRLNNPKTVFLTHGNMLKNYFDMHPQRLETITYYDYMAALGPFMRDEFIRSGIDKTKLVDIGIARTDEIHAIAGSIQVSDKLKRIGVPSDRPVVSYLPTFWGDSSVSKLGISILESASEDYTVLFRPHPQTPKQIIDRYSDVISRPNVFYLPEVDQSHPSLLDVYMASSVIIGDLSSVMLEAILLDKPLVFAKPDTSSNVNLHNQLQDIQTYCAAITPENVDDISQVISETIQKGIDTQTWNASKERSFFNYDGTSVQRIKDFLNTLQ